MSKGVTRRVLVVCTGNLCRSPLGEHLLRHHLTRRGVDDVVVASAGTCGVEGGAVPEEGVVLAAARGLDVTAHAPAQLTGALLDDTDLVLCATRAHAREVFVLRPGFGLDRVALLEDAVPSRAGEDLPDPYLRDDDVWRAVFERLDEATEAWAERLAQG